MSSLFVTMFLNDIIICSKKDLVIVDSLLNEF